jgi:flavin reductase (DIM6/NTAB) family NADH-FMN oxidoreductase RutF
VVLLTTAHKGRVNVMTLSWHMMVEFEPPRVACVVSDADFSFIAMQKTKQCVIAIPAVELAGTVVAIGNCSGRSVDKFRRFGLTALPSQRVLAPRIAECFANLECRVIDTRLVRSFGLFVLEVVAAAALPQRARGRTLHHQGYGTFVIDGETLTLKSRKR